MRSAPARLSFLILTILLLAAGGATLPAQLRVQPVGEQPGDQALRLMLRKLGSSGTFMETTAHPDDEDNALLAMLGHGQGMRAVLVTATRGDGGQNEIGPEIFEALGVLRTEELGAAHRFDGAEQYFTRAIDFGYSFSVEESLEKWGHDAILGDFVRHIRTIRPDVIAGFVCGGGGGGQHHQASAQLTVEAFRAAADPARFPEQLAEGLRPWQAQRVFCTDVSGFLPAAQRPPRTRDLLTVPVTAFDPVLGRTYAEIGLEARSMHKCQGTSQLLLLPGESGFGAEGRTYQLRDTVLGEPGVAPASLFEGIDTTLVGLTRFAGPNPPPALVTGLKEITASVTAATEAVAGTGQFAAAPPLAKGLMTLRDLRAKLPILGLADGARYEIDLRLAQKEDQFQQALVLSQGLRLEALADDGLIVPGQPIKVSIVAGTGGADAVTMKGVKFQGLDGATNACTGAIARDEAMTCAAELRVPAKAEPTTAAYWQPRTDAARYDFAAGAPFGVPFRPSPFGATFDLAIAGVPVSVERTIQYRYSDLFAGEKRMELSVVPSFAVRVTPEIAVIPTSGPVASAAGMNEPQLRGDSAAAGRKPQGRQREIKVTITNQEKTSGTAAVSLQVPSGWQVSPSSAPVKFSREDEAITLAFEVSAPAGAGPGEYAVTAVVDSGKSDRSRSNQGYTIIEYPHITRRHVVETARTRVQILDVAIASGLRVGYIMGVGDEMPAAIEQLGAEVHLIEEEELASGDLSRYNVIVTGVRAYERRGDLRANNHRLLEYVEKGGTVLVNYNKGEFNQAQYGPYPAKNSSDRITDELAPVEVLVPGSPVFNRPNRLGPETWANWVQERGTYFLTEKDPRYEDLVRMTDPFPYNPKPKTGALVRAQYGKGQWIYLGLGLWRQLPAGTSGAYRLLANLLSLGAH
jgi:LmbE family N-acetylglucosaminyl deacetylase